MGCSAKSQVNTASSVIVRSQPSQKVNPQANPSNSAPPREFISVANLPDPTQQSPSPNLDLRKYFTIPASVTCNGSAISTPSNHSSWSTLIFISPLQKKLSIELQVTGENSEFTIVGGIILADKKNLPNVKFDSSCNLNVWTYEGTGFTHSQYGTFSYNAEQWKINQDDHVKIEYDPSQSQINFFKNMRKIYQHETDSGPLFPIIQLGAPNQKLTILTVKV
ncbi:unnamed protein product [Blepharisma stoltei]|uniref:Uncharacterized protein n=1 Tax=Blepharisma stoltei TaxID=1481888 RepID=A0AAU9JEQ7_9CILI|nr:unnamed protein product [Blepharisma stoltei]